MYGQNLGGRPDDPGEPIFTKLCMLFRVPDVFLNFELQKDRMKNVGAVGVEISPLPLKRHIAYTTACCYRTSRDGMKSKMADRKCDFSLKASTLLHLNPTSQAER